MADLLSYPSFLRRLKRRKLNSRAINHESGELNQEVIVQRNIDMHYRNIVQGEREKSAEKQYPKLRSFHFL